MCVLISLVALAEEAAAAVQEKIEETAAAEFAILKLHLAQMSHQIVPDAAILGMSSAGLLVALNMLFQATDMDFLDHPQFRDTTEIDPAAYPDYMRHALVTSLHEQGVQFSSAMMIWLQPLSLSACQAYDVATLWGNNPEYEFKIAASRLCYCSRSKQLEFVSSAFLRCRMDTAASLPPGHPDIEACRRAVLEAVKMSGIRTANDWSEEQYDEEEQDEEEPGLDPAPTTFQQAIAPWNLLPVPSPLCALQLSRQDREAKITQAALNYNVTSFEATDPRELLEKVNRINRNILIGQTDSAAESKFPHKIATEFYSANQMKAYNEKMDSCRALEKMMLSHSEPSLRVELGSLQYQIAQEAANLWVTADMGFSAARKFAQTLEGAADVSYLTVFKEGLEVAKATQEAERLLHAQQQQAATIAAAAAARQPRASAPRSYGRPYGDPNAWGDAAWESGTSGPTRKRGGAKAGLPAYGGKAAAPTAAIIQCYRCGEVGHKSNACTQAYALEDASGPWQPEAQPAIGWRADWVAPEDNQNARQAWSDSNWQESAAKGAGKTGGKSGSKGKSGAKGFGGYGKGGGATSGDKGGGKGNGWSTGGRGKGAAWSSWSWPGS